MLVSEAQTYFENVSKRRAGFIFLTPFFHQKREMIYHDLPNRVDLVEMRGIEPRIGQCE